MLGASRTDPTPRCEICPYSTSCMASCDHSYRGCWVKIPLSKNAALRAEDQGQILPKSHHIQGSP